MLKPQLHHHARGLLLTKSTKTNYFLLLNLTIIEISKHKKLQTNKTFKTHFMYVLNIFLPH